jgi:FkbM family methyltransferase
LEPLSYIQSRRYRGTVIIVGEDIEEDAIFLARSCRFDLVVAVGRIGALKNLPKRIIETQCAPVEVLVTHVSDRAELFLNLHQDANGRKSFVSEVPIGPDSKRVTAVSLDEICVGRRKINLIKIDADTHELEILKSSAETLRRYRPDLCIGTHAAHTRLIARMLESYGYVQANALSRSSVYAVYFVHVGSPAVAITRMLGAGPRWIGSGLVWRWKWIVSRVAMARRRWW